jgi:hypothetical protein
VLETLNASFRATLGLFQTLSVHRALDPPRRISGIKAASMRGGVWVCTGRGAGNTPRTIQEEDSSGLLGRPEGGVTKAKEKTPQE